MSRNNNIYLVGFMGTGKTEVGKLLAAKLNRNFIDTDSIVVSEMGTSISQIFADHGEDFFRKTESAALKKVVKGSDSVISCGGGILLRKENMKLMKENGITVFLSASPHTIISRLEGKKDRPLLVGELGEDRFTRIEYLLSERISRYRSSDLTIITDDKSPDMIAEEINNLVGNVD